MVTPESVEKQYDHFAFIVSRVAAWKLGQEPSETIKDDWIAVARAARMIDWQVDNTIDRAKRLDFISQVDEFLSGRSQVLQSDETVVKSDIEQLKKVLGGYSDETRSRFADDGRMLLRVTEKTREAIDGQTYSTCKRLEGQIVARLFFRLAS